MSAPRAIPGSIRPTVDQLDADRAAGHEIGDATIAHLTPARFEAINPYGLLTFEVAKILNRTNRRPLRTL